MEIYFTQSRIVNNPNPPNQASIADGDLHPVWAADGMYFGSFT